MKKIFVIYDNLFERYFTGVPHEDRSNLAPVHFDDNILYAEKFSNFQMAEDTLNMLFEKNLDYMGCSVFSIKAFYVIDHYKNNK